MRAKNKTPFCFAAFPSSRHPPAPSATLVVRGTFKLAPGEPVAPLAGLGEQGSLVGDVFAPEDDDRRGALLYASDFADYKPKADILVAACCHTPSGKPLTECPVRVTVGSWTKVLRVVGPRTWQDGLLGSSASPPAPFTEMPLDYAHAFGGPDMPENPAGRGAGTAQLHNVESADDVVRSRNDRIGPASFAPLSPFWPQRRSKVGKDYGDEYAKTRAPYVSSDFDWSYFNAAPVDQQIAPLRGDEELSFLNLHPRASSFSASLPALRVRAFVIDDRGRFREVTLVLDTLLADLRREALVLTWRGVEPVREDDAADLSCALVVSENLGDPPAPAASFREELDGFQRDPTGFEARRTELFGARDHDGERDRGVTYDPPRASLGPEGPLRDAPAGTRERLRLMLEGADAAPVDGAPLGQRIDAAMASPPANAAAPIAMPRKPGSIPYVPLGTRLRSLREVAERAQAQLAKPEVASRAGSSSGGKELNELSALEGDPFIRQLDPYGFQPQARGTEEPAAGVDLTGRDLTGADLAGRDLSGACLEGAILTRANLRGANLRDARMKHAILHEADVTGADFTAADLTQANLTAVAGEGAVFRQACVDQTTFARARLAEANFEGAKGEYAIYSGAQLDRANLRQAALYKGFFDGASLEQTDLSSSTLKSCRFTAARGKDAKFSGASLDQTTFERAELAGARFDQSTGDRTAFRMARLDAASFQYARFTDPFFDEAVADKGNFTGASLRGARLYRASLVSAHAPGADLLRADLRKANLEGASLAGANLFQSQLRLTRLDGCDLRGANLDRSVTDGRAPAKPAST
ncbi:MAG: DUF2169 domain-containing protein [Polyangiaceae bacterium]|nr:DUF2169 domain-containing protein [Polyangiaceae bacterium]